MKIASTKKAMPSSANGRPRTSPKRDIKPGHSRPISKLQDRAGHGADGEEHGRRLRPLVGEVEGAT